MQFLSDTLRKKEKAQVLDEKSIRASNIEILWATLFLGSYSAPTLKKKLAIFLYPAGMSLTKRSLGGNNLIIPGQEEFGV